MSFQGTSVFLGHNKIPQFETLTRIHTPDPLLLLIYDDFTKTHERTKFVGRRKVPSQLETILYRVSTMEMMNFLQVLTSARICRRVDSLQGIGVAVEVQSARNR